MAEQKKPKPRAKGRKKWPKGSKQPVVLNFRPIEYEFVPPERFREWQEAMVKWVGLPRELVERMNYTGHEVETYSGGGGWDD
jgi:hypothetical protein